MPLHFIGFFPIKIFGCGATCDWSLLTLRCFFDGIVRRSTEQAVPVFDASRPEYTKDKKQHAKEQTSNHFSSWTEAVELAFDGENNSEQRSTTYNVPSPKERTPPSNAKENPSGIHPLCFRRVLFLKFWHFPGFGPQIFYLVQIVGPNTTVHFQRAFWGLREKLFQ